ncbi:hypothetical protein V6N13_083854 [Hibiscus sabdariffa]|uniref:Uncharacterized protein n=1 Tax=Hibiscus sabdariffa TaxID=183260 RepID=A0ABR2SZB3_9ROSI
MRGWDWNGEGEGGNSGWGRGYLGPWRAGDEAVVAAGNEVGGAVNVDVAAVGNAITDETSVAFYAELVEEVKGLTDELNGWVAGDGNAGEWMSGR